MATNLTDFFAGLKFKVDTKDLDTLQTKLDNIKKTIKSINSSYSGIKPKTTNPKSPRSPPTGQPKLFDAEEFKQSSEYFRLKSQLYQMDAKKARQDQQYVKILHSRINTLNKEKRLVNEAKQDIRELVAQKRREYKENQRLTRSQRTLSDARQRAKNSLKQMVFTTVSAYGALEGIKSINRIGQDFEAMESSMLAAMGSTEVAGEQLDFLERLTRRLGLSMRDTSNEYTKFIFASRGKLPTEEVNLFFQSVAEAGTVLGISRERMKLSFNALQQMLNKTNVQSEELKRQLAESFPGAIQIFARAMGVSEKELFKMMEDGQVLAHEIFPAVGAEMRKIANQAGALDAKLKTTRVAQGRLNNAWEQFADLIFKSGLNEGLARLFNSLAEWMNKNSGFAMHLGSTLNVVFSLLSMIVKILTPAFEVLSVIMEVINKLTFGWGNGILSALGAIRLLMPALVMLKGMLMGINTTMGLIFRKIMLVVGAIGLLYQAGAFIYEKFTGKEAMGISQLLGIDQFLGTAQGQAKTTTSNGNTPNIDPRLLSNNHTMNIDKMEIVNKGDRMSPEAVWFEAQTSV